MDSGASTQRSGYTFFRTQPAPGLNHALAGLWKAEPRQLLPYDVRQGIGREAPGAEEGYDFALSRTV